MAMAKKIKRAFQVFYLLALLFSIFFTLSTIPLVRCLSQLCMGLSCLGMLPYCGGMRNKSSRMDTYGFLLFGVAGIACSIFTLFQSVI